VGIGVVMLIGMIGCGMGQKEIDEAKSRIEALKAKGVPDSLLSSPRVFLSQVQSAKKGGNSGILRQYGDSLMNSIERAETWYEASIKEAKPFVDSLRQSLSSRKEGLSGLHLAYADSILNAADSLVKNNLVFTAKDKCLHLDTMLPKLHEEQVVAQKIQPRLLGKWNSTRVVEKLGGVEKRTLQFGKDGSLKVTESMKGQTQPALKEDWEFISWGTYALRGDTVYFNIEREKCPRQIFWNRQDNKWVKSEKPVYDSTITDGRKDRFMTYDYIKEQFKK